MDGGGLQELPEDIHPGRTTARWGAGDLLEVEGEICRRGRRTAWVGNQQHRKDKEEEEKKPRCNDCGDFFVIVLVVVALVGMVVLVVKVFMKGGILKHEVDIGHSLQTAHSASLPPPPPKKI